MVFDVTQKMMTAIDVLALDIKTKGEVFPPMLDIMNSLDRFPGIDKNATFYVKLKRQFDSLE